MQKIWFNLISIRIVILPAKDSCQVIASHAFLYQLLSLDAVYVATRTSSSHAHAFWQYQSLAHDPLFITRGLDMRSIRSAYPFLIAMMELQRHRRSIVLSVDTFIRNQPGIKTV